jgi:Cyclin, C-terminal domain
MSRTSEFLDVKPSRQAAAAIWLAVRMIESKVGSKVGLVAVKQVCKKPPSADPLSFWSDQMQQVTLIQRIELQEVYSKLLKLLNKYLFRNVLFEDPDLWIDKKDCLSMKVTLEEDENK